MKITLNNLQDVYKAEKCNVETMELRGYKLVEEMFVDSSGFGAENEPALTVNQFDKKVKELIEKEGELQAKMTNCGQFQVYIGFFKKVETPKMKKIGQNTYERWQGRTQIIRYHDTDVIEIQPNKIILRSGGWETSTTKRRINNFLPKGYNLFQRKFDWYVSIEKDKKTIPFEDGMIIKL
jgi:hypothetical protein